MEAGVGGSLEDWSPVLCRANRSRYKAARPIRRHQTLIVRPNQICDLLQLSCKTHNNLFMFECRRLNGLHPPGHPGVEGVWTCTPSRIKYKTCHRVEVLLLSQRPFISGANCVCGRPPAVGYLPSEVGGRICTQATTKHFTPQNTQKCVGVVQRCCSPDSCILGLT